MRQLSLVLAASLALTACSAPPHPAGGSARDSIRRDSLARDSIPNEVRRRLAQALWPENLFDSTGRPERGFVQREFKPAFPDLQVREVAAPATLPGVSLYVGSATLPTCVHCRTNIYAVARRGTEFVTLLGPDDLQYLAAWVSPSVLDDTLRLRAFAVSALRATCFLGCEVTRVSNRADLGVGDSPLLRPVNRDSATWHLPRAYAWQHGGGALVEFALFDPRGMVYAARAEWNGTALGLAFEPVAALFH